MNVYEEAHALSKAIKESEEFKQYDYLKKVIDQKPELASMIKDFQEKQMEVQTKQLLGEEMSADVMQNIQNLYQIICKDPTAAQYMQAEMRFAVMMNDVYKIIGDTMGIGNIQ